jgi:hypothetical protein
MILRLLELIEIVEEDSSQVELSSPAVYFSERQTLYGGGTTAARSSGTVQF